VVGIDSVNKYYDPALKEARLCRCSRAIRPKFAFVKLDLADRAATEAPFSQYGFAEVVHLAAQAGVGYSLQNPHAFQRTVVGRVCGSRREPNARSRR
jgi:UDP-glucuronate 4-epimerase